MNAAWLVVAPWLAALAGVVAGRYGCGEATGHARASRAWTWDGAPLAEADASTFVVDTAFLGEADAADRFGAWQAGRRRRAGIDAGAAP